MSLENGYPDHAPTYILSIGVYLMTIVVSVILLFVLFKSHKNTTQNSSPRAIKLSVICCLLFSFCRSLSWCISNVGLLMMVYQIHNIHELNELFKYSTITGYIFQLLYVLTIAYFLKEKLIHTFDDTHVKIKENGIKFWRISFIIYSGSAIIFNLFYIISYGLSLHQYVNIENIVSLIWMAVSTTYNLSILILFDIKLHQLYYKGYSEELNEKLQSFITRQATLIWFIIIMMILYIIGTYLCFHVHRGENINNLIGWHIMYVITQIIVILSVFLTLNFNHNYYMKHCKYCHCLCLCICTCARNTSFVKGYGPLIDTDEDESSYENTIADITQTTPQNTKAVELQDIKVYKQGLCDHKCEFKIQSICTLLEYHNHNNDIMQYMAKNNYTLSDLQNDFNHLLECHDSNQDFDEMHTKLTVDDVHSHYKQCNAYSRHYSRRNGTQRCDITKGREVKTGKDVATITLDNIHSFYYHSYDTCLRRKYVDDCDNTDDDDEIHQISDHDMGNKKFSSNLNANNNNADVYSFGYRYEYENDRDTWFIEKRYSTFQQELIQNTYQTKEKTNCAVSKEEYDEEVKKCNKYMECDRIKMLQKRNMSEKLQKEHILALLVYCNCDNYQLAWNETFRREMNSRRTSHPIQNRRRLSFESNSSSDSDKSNDEEMKQQYIKDQKPISIQLDPYEADVSLMQKHAYFYWSSKYLMQLIECFGERLIDDNNKRVNKTFWRGVKKVLYPTNTIAQFYGPLSTSEEIDVAKRFSGGIGIMLALKYSYSTDPLSARYFDCKYFSDYANEKECLFMGGKPMMIIMNIIQFKHDKMHKYKKYMNAINIINCLLNGTYNGSDIIKINPNSIDLCHDLLSNQLLKQSDNNHVSISQIIQIPEYILNLAHKYCSKLQHIIIFWDRFENMAKLKQLLCCNDLPFFNLDILLVLFPNIEQIEYSNQSLFSSNDTTIRNIVDYLMKNLPKYSKLKRIIIHHTLSVPSTTSYIKNDNWTIAAEKEKIILKNSNVKLDLNKLSIHLPERQRGLSAATLLRKMTWVQHQHEIQ